MINDLYIKHTRPNGADVSHKIFTDCAKGDLRRGHVANWEEPVTMND